MDSLVGPITDGILARILPQMKQLVANAAEGAEPVVRKVVVEEVLPKFGTVAVIGLAAGAAVAAAIGAYFASRR